MPSRNITLIVRAVGARAAARQIEQTGNAVERMGYKASKAGKSMRMMGDSFTHMGHTLTHSVTAPIVGVGVAAIKSASDFRSSMVLIQAHAGATRKEVDLYTKTILRLSGRELTQAPNELAKALYHIRSVGKIPGPIGEDYIGMLKAASQLATVGHAPIEETASALAGLAKTNMPGLTNLNQIVGEINATVGTGNMRMADFNELVSTGVFPVAKEAGLKFRDVAAATAVLTDENWKAARAGTLLRTSLHFLTAPSDRAAKAMQKVGITPAQLAEDLQKPNGLLVALADLKGHLDTLPLSERNIVKGAIFPTGRGTPLYVLMNQLDNYQAKITQIGDLAPHFQQGLQATLATPGAKFEKARALLMGDLIKIGDDIAPNAADAVLRVAEAIDKLTGKWTALNPETKKWIERGALVAAISGPILVGIGGLMKLAGVAMQLSGILTGGAGAVLRVLTRGKVGGKGKGGGLLGGLKEATGMRVFVTNWPVGMGGPGVGKPAGRLGGKAKTIVAAIAGALGVEILIPAAAAAAGVEVARHAPGPVNPRLQAGNAKHPGRLLVPGDPRRRASRGGAAPPMVYSPTPSSAPVQAPGTPTATSTYGGSGYYEVAPTAKAASSSDNYVLGSKPQEYVTQPVQLTVDGKVLATAVHRAALKQAAVR